MAEADLSKIGVAPGVGTKAEPKPDPEPTPRRRARKPKAPKEPAKLTWAERHTHKKLWLEIDQLERVKAKLEDNGDGQSVASLVGELFDKWLDEDD